jgi:hypothetical protein
MTERLKHRISKQNVGKKFRRCSFPRRSSKRVALVKVPKISQNDVLHTIWVMQCEERQVALRTTAEIEIKHRQGFRKSDLCLCHEYNTLLMFRLSWLESAIISSENQQAMTKYRMANSYQSYRAPVFSASDGKPTRSDRR